MITETERLLLSIDTTLKQLLGVSIERMQRATGQRPAAAGYAPTSNKSGEIASDRDLDSQHGDPVIKAKDPRDWTGESMIGRTFSQCPADYLDMLADRYDYFASKETDEKKIGYNVRDASRARGWALRVRAGKVTQNNDDEGADEPPPGY